MEQFEQLLTCAICLDRYRNPKLLPCQHSFCMEPCMDGLVDYVRRQVKCPECRAEHRIPYQGVQGFPTNVTLQRFLELHIEITGELPDPTSGQVMERCNVCSEKSYCSVCVHCEKKICSDCKGAHMDILRREIARINNQVRRALHRLQDSLALVEKNSLSLQQNCLSVSEEIDEIYRRLSKALKDRTEFLRGEIDRYLSTEVRNLSTLKQNLELEISNIQSNCDLADKHMTEAVEWDDCELMDAKEIFLKTVEFIRNFEYENADYNRRVRFSMSTDPNQLVLHVAGYGELTINMPHQPFIGVGGSGGGIVSTSSSTGLLQPPGGPGLMRSKSDHRLASQFRQQEERGVYDRGYGDGSGDPSGTSGRVSPLGRKFGERHSQNRGGNDRYEQQQSRYGGRSGGGGDYSGEFESPYDTDGNRPRSKYRSRFSRHHGDNADSDNDTQGNRSVRFSEGHKERERVLDTEDVARGPLSGISRLYDSPRVMKRLQESEQRGKKKETVPPTQTPPLQVKAPQQVPKRTQRQVSEEDEISKIKRANKTGASASVAADTTTQPTQEVGRPVSERIAALKSPRDTSSDDRDSSQPSSPTSRLPPRDLSSPTRKTPGTEVASSDAESDDGSSVSSLQQTQRKTPGKTGSGNVSRRSSGSSDVAPHKKATRSASSDSSTSSESSAASTSAVKATTTTFTPEEPRQKVKVSPAESPAGSGASTPRNRLSSTGSDTPKKPFQSRFLPNRQTPTTTPPPAVETPTKEEEEDEEEESESSSESEETDSEDESADEAGKKKPEPPVVNKSAMERSDIGPLLARSAQARDTSEAARKNSKDETSTTSYGKSRYGSGAETTPSSYRQPYVPKDDPPAAPTGSKYLSRSRGSVDEDSSPPSRYGSGSGYTSRFLNKSKSSAVMSPDEEADSGGKKYSTGDDASKYPSGRSRYAALKDRRARLARSRSSHNFGGPDDEEPEDSPSSPTSSMPATYLASRYGPGSQSSNDLARSRSTHALKSRDNSPDRSAAGTEKDGAALSSWARYLKNKYGNKASNRDGGGSGSGASSSPSASATAARRLSLGLPLRHNSASVDSSDDDQKNPGGSPTSPTAATVAATGFAAAAGSCPRSQYLQKRRQQFKIGSRGSEPGCFTWPRGIAVGPDNSIVVADSSNHRVQVFDANGIFAKEFGSYGNSEGEFDCLAGVAVNRIGQFIIADRYNHRIQVLDPSGRFLRAFGSQGTADGRFNYPWGITTDALGFIYVCDKENHRVQRSSSGRPRLHIRSRLGQQPHTDLPSRWNISSGVRMLGIRGWGIQGTGRDRCHVQWQHSSLRQREPPHSSFLTAPATNSNCQFLLNRPHLINRCVTSVQTKTMPRTQSPVYSTPGRRLTTKFNLRRS
ncbi:RING finger protein nhl-1 isoform X2 [Zootermopsis nevadensis]|uniref:RING finger protein nhl-1 isoform X2 n=1 Tax=Zootermopsis nevadensis TaxID=136037 RepID=UPI000B8E7766|nr:RING finger protein nhl-1 isoform X2 [Zootermopsis nevadensis]